MIEDNVKNFFKRIIYLLETKVATTPTAYNIVLASADTEYSQLLPVGTKDVRFRCRTAHDIRYSFEEGKVATSGNPHLVLPAGFEYWSDMIEPSNLTYYFASSQAGVVVELEVWS